MSNSRYYQPEIETMPLEEMQALHLDVPQVTLLAHLLRQKGLDIPEGILTKEELAEAICKSK